MGVEVWEVKGFKTELNARRYAHRNCGTVVKSNYKQYKWMATERGIDDDKYPFMVIVKVM